MAHKTSYKLIFVEMQKIQNESISRIEIFHVILRLSLGWCSWKSAAALTDIDVHVYVGFVVKKIS